MKAFLIENRINDIHRLYFNVPSDNIADNEELFPHFRLLEMVTFLLCYRRDFHQTYTTKYTLTGQYKISVRMPPEITQKVPANKRI